QNIGDAPINVSDVVSEQEFDFTDIFLQVDGVAVTQDIAVVQPQAILTISFELEVDSPEDLVNTDIIVTSDAQNPELRIPLIFVEEAPAGPGIFAEPVIVDLTVEDTVATAVIRLENIGESSITITDVVSEQEFSLVNTFVEATVQPGGIITLSIQLQTNTSNAINDILIVRSNAETPELRIPLILEAEEEPLEPGIFGEPLVNIFRKGNNIFGKIKIKNVGESPIVITDILTQKPLDTKTIINGKVLSLQNNTVEPNGTVIIKFVKKLRNLKIFEDIITIESDASNQKLLIPVKFVKKTLSLNQFKNNKKGGRSISIFPNPVRSETTFKVSFSNPENAIIQLTNVLQRSVLNRSRVMMNSNGTGKLFMNSLPNGIYILTIKDPATGIVYQSKIVKI
ncbi:T9SS type A sorting domain-containing protein, partial [Hyunsoonleella sp. 2307UL5-6]|uniref:T9SS type A sorting domain-containing protein n=1 Tax=Hyunsoonleella sp. 2307UL5-6 TaxID=3384768 RepID=UPI0039BCA15A